MLSNVCIVISCYTTSFLREVTDYTSYICVVFEIYVQQWFYFVQFLIFYRQFVFGAKTRLTGWKTCLSTHLSVVSNCPYQGSNLVSSLILLYVGFCTPTLLQCCHCWSIYICFFSLQIVKALLFFLNWCTVPCSLFEIVILYTCTGVIAVINLYYDTMHFGGNLFIFHYLFSET